MAPVGLLASAILGLAASTSFAFVAARLARRAPDGDAGVAHRAFRIWWIAASAYAFLVGALLNTLAFVGWTNVAVFATARQMSLLILVIGLAGLLHYVSFLWSGWSAGRTLWALVGLAIYAIVLFAYADTSVAGVRIGEFDTRLVFAPPPHPALAAGALAMLTLPPLAAAAALLALAPRLDPAARRRVILVGASLLAWFGASLLAAVDAPGSWVLTRPVLGLAAARCVVLAYAPPRAIEAWAARADERRSALTTRVRQLV